MPLLMVSVPIHFSIGGGGGGGGVECQAMIGCHTIKK